MQLYPLLLEFVKVVMINCSIKCLTIFVNTLVEYTNYMYNRRMLFIAEVMAS